MKQILILIMLLISFGSVSGQEEEFESKYLPGVKEDMHRDEIVKMEINCLPIEEELKEFLYLFEMEKFNLNKSYEESNILSDRWSDLHLRETEIIDQIGRDEWQLRLDDINEELDPFRREQDRLRERVEDTYEYYEKYLIIYTALCK